VPDLSEVNRALFDGEWKAATVLGGSVIEALLLWKLQQLPPTEVDTAITELRASGKLTQQPHTQLERWDLHEFTEVAARLAITKPDTADQVRLARKFRNFIHPGRSQRLGQRCDRATALSAVAGVEHAIRDLC